MAQNIVTADNMKMIYDMLPVDHKISYITNLLNMEITGTASPELQTTIGQFLELIGY